jgi:hypothetical protein
MMYIGDNFNTLYYIKKSDGIEFRYNIYSDFPGPRSIFLQYLHIGGIIGVK